MKEKVEQFYKDMYSMPPTEDDFERFGKQIIEDFIVELKKKQIAVVWNYGFDSVVFSNKLDQIKEEFFGNGNNKSNSNESPGTGTLGDAERDQTSN